MSELDDFRPRIRNWARVYKDHFGRQQSPLAIVLRTLKEMRRRAENEDPSKEDLLEAEERQEREVRRAAIDEADADFIDQCVLRLEADRRKVLYVAYLDPRASETFEATQDAAQADRVKAHLLGCSRTKDFKYFLTDAEKALMYKVRTAEELFG